MINPSTQYQKNNDIKINLDEQFPEDLVLNKKKSDDCDHNHNKLFSLEPNNHYQNGDLGDKKESVFLKKPQLNKKYFV